MNCTSTPGRNIHVFPFFAAGHLLLPLPMQSTSATRMFEEPSNSFISLSQSLRQTLPNSIDSIDSWFMICVMKIICMPEGLTDVLFWNLMTLKETRGEPKSYLRLVTGFIFLQWPHLFSRVKTCIMSNMEVYIYIQGNSWKGRFHHNVFSSFRRLHHDSPTSTRWPWREKLDKNSLAAHRVIPRLLGKNDTMPHLRREW